MEMTRRHRHGPGRGPCMELGVNREGGLQASGVPGNPHAKAPRAAGCCLDHTFNCHRKAGAEEGHRIRLDLPTRLQA